MCGIAGFNWMDKNIIKKMMKSISHRGPDESGTYFDDNISFGHQRLKIIDLKTGKQPIHNEDESIQIIFNGEIYNYLDLKKDLEQKGHRFYTNTDTEVIVHSYEEYGMNCVNKFNGMFAFAIWDSNKKKLFLARDRLGIKPLYYYFNREKFIFASEIKAILEWEEIDRKVDINALNEYFTYRYVPSNRTMFENIYKLLPGHILVFENNKTNISRYWDLKENITNNPESYYISKLQELLRASIKMRLISDVPLGVYLSGGIDSSCIVALMNEITDNIKTFSVGFGNEGDSEFSYARFVSDQFGTDHHEINVDEGDLKILPQMIWHLDEPIADAATLPTYVISRHAKKEVTVVLSGEGGDELFAGYDNYKIMTFGQSFSKATPNFFKHVISTFAEHLPAYSNSKRVIDLICADNENERYMNIMSLFNKKEIEMLNVNKDDSFNNYFPNNMKLLNKLLYFGINTWLPNDFFMKVDKMTMAHAIEERVPLLDYKIAEFSFMLPTDLKLKGITGKYIFKKAMVGIVPNKIIYRKKRGYNAPMDYWLKHSLKDILEQLLEESSHNLYNTKYALKLLKEFQKSGKNYDENFYNSQKLWGFLVFEMWHKIFIEGENLEKIW
jgi:asparagine synthase (glutamine-hydrolysing)